MTWVVVTTYRRRVSPGSNEARTGGMEMSVLRSSSALCVSFVQRKEADFFNNLYRGNPRSPSWDMKRLRAARHPMSYWTSLASLTWYISVMAEILSGFNLMPHLVMMYPRSLPRGTQKVHFSGFNLMLRRLRLVKVSSWSAMRLQLCHIFMMMSST
jgi:hypothetical protein